MLFTQKSVVLASVALLAFVANQESGIMVNAQGNDKEDKEDDDGEVIEDEDGPVVINAPAPGIEMVNNSTDDMIDTPPIVNLDDLELPSASDDSNTTDNIMIGDDEIDGCMCDRNKISCTDPEDEEMCMCESDGTLVCQDEEPPSQEASGDAAAADDTESPVEAPTTDADVPVASPVAVPDDQEPPAPDTGMETESGTAAATDDSSATTCSTSSTMIAMALSAAGLAVALN